MVLIVDKVYCGEMILFVFRLKCFYNIEYSDTMEKQTISFYAFFLRPLYLRTRKHKIMVNNKKNPSGIYKF